MFVPQTSIDDAEWTKWLAEISIISAALSRSRPIKESQPFKQLTLKALPKINGEVQIEDAFLDKYPADVIRLVAMAPKIRAKQAVPKQLEKLAENYLEQYQQLQALFDDVQEHLHPFLLDSENVSKTKRKNAAPRDHTNPEATRVDKKRKASTKKILSIDSLAVIVTAQLLEEVQQAYQQENFHEMWTRLTNFLSG